MPRKEVINLYLTEFEGATLRYAIAAWFSVHEGDHTKTEELRAKALDDIQDNIRRQERMIEQSKARTR